jgi:hypothetical protein
MKKTTRRRLALERDAVRILSELPPAALPQVRGGIERTTPEGGCASSSQQSTSVYNALCAG